MAKNLVNGSNIKVIESGNNISLDFTSGNSLEAAITQNTNDIEEIKDAEVYSTSEVKTNKVWIDGKPIYRKVLQFTTTIEGENLFSIAHNISNADYIYVEKFYMSNQNAKCYEVPSVGYDGNITDKVYSYIDRNNLYVYSNGGWNTAWVKNVIIEYTKTTD